MWVFLLLENEGRRLTLAAFSHDPKGLSMTGYEPNSVEYLLDAMAMMACDHMELQAVIDAAAMGRTAHEINTGIWASVYLRDLVDSIYT